MGADPDGDVIVYGAPASLYTAKVRSWLQAFHIPFEERFPSHPRYRQTIRPSMETHRIPVVEFADGALVQDSTAILDAFEARYPEACAMALGPRQQLTVHLWESLADRALAKPAMHFRWSFPDTNEAFLVGEFGRSLAFPGPPEEIERLGRRVAGKMSSYLPMLGIEPRTIPTIERAYARTLDLLEAHFAVHPYLLGGAPTRADCALMGPLFGHLGRDPYPCQMMQLSAPLTFRWTERMTWGERRTPEFPLAPRAALPDDQIPETLIALMQHLFEGFGDELVQSARQYDSWIVAHPDAPSGSWVSPEGADQPALGPITFDYHGVAITQQALGHSLWIFQRALDFMASLDEESRALCADLGARIGATEALRIRLGRRLTRVRKHRAVA